MLIIGFVKSWHRRRRKHRLEILAEVDPERQDTRRKRRTRASEYSCVQHGAEAGQAVESAGSIYLWPTPSLASTANSQSSDLLPATKVDRASSNALFLGCDTDQGMSKPVRSDSHPSQTHSDLDHPSRLWLASNDSFKTCAIPSILAEELQDNTENITTIVQRPTAAFPPQVRPSGIKGLPIQTASPASSRLPSASPNVLQVCIASPLSSVDTVSDQSDSSMAALVRCENRSCPRRLIKRVDNARTGKQLQRRISHFIEGIEMDTVIPNTQK